MSFLITMVDIIDPAHPSFNNIFLCSGLRQEAGKVCRLASCVGTFVLVYLFLSTSFESGPARKPIVGNPVGHIN